MAHALYYPNYTPGVGARPRYQSIHPFRNLVAAGSHVNNQWDNGQSGYGLDPPDYDYHSGPPAHMPTGGSYSYHATGGSGYGPPPQPAAVHPPAKPIGGTAADGGKKGLFSGGSGKKGSSAMSALTLLSFLFFINLLQGCIKDHMDAMNPTVMVMTTNVIRNRFNKMGDMNAREQKPPAASNTAKIDQHVPDLTVAAAAAQANAVLQAHYSNNMPTNPYNQPFQTPSPSPAQQPPPHYMPSNTEPEIPITYNKPYYDPHKPDAYDHMIQLPAPQQTLPFNNHSYYNMKPSEQTYTYHHTAYNAQTIAQPHPQPQSLPPKPIISTQYSVNQNPFYEHQYPVISKPYNSDSSNSPYGPEPQDHNYRQPQPQQHSYTPSVAPNNAYPWSTNTHTSSVVSGPYRRASIISVSPKTKWISVPAKLTDRTNFNGNSRLESETEEEVVHHDDRDLFHSRQH